MLYTEANIRGRMQGLAHVHRRHNVSLVDLLKINHLLMSWAMANGLMGRIGAEDMHKTEPFWLLCEEHGISLSQEEKEEIFNHFIED